MKLRIIRWAVIVSAFILSGAPTVMMQVGAWGMMVGERDETETIGNALKVAFLGSEPCHRCDLISIGFGEEKEGAAELRWLIFEQLLGLKRDAIWLSKRKMAQPLLVFSMGPESVEKRSEGPPTPPPRWGFLS